MSFSCSCSFIRKINIKLCIYVLCLLLPFILSPLAISPHKESRCGYVILLVASYWLLEPVHLAAASLLPVVLFPVLGVVSSTEICTNYMKEPFMMFIGGLIVAIAIEDCRLHERIALKVLLFVGTEMKWLMLGFMLTTMFLSMWISNTATTAMMVPIVEAIIGAFNADDGDLKLTDINGIDSSCTESKEQISTGVEDSSTKEDDQENSNSEGRSSIKVVLLLSICYAANIGGTGTITGTGPNLVLKGLLDELHPESDEITFATWMMYNIPGMLICVTIGWIYLWLVYIKFSHSEFSITSKDRVTQTISKSYSKLGPICFHEAVIIALFVTLVMLWTFRDPKFVAGWGGAIGSGAKIGDSVPSVFIAFLLFLVPSNPRDLSSRPLLEWKTAQDKLPWGVILLSGGGFALADATQKSGLSVLLGRTLSSLDVLPPSAIAAIICFMTAMLTEIVTNTTTATILLPVFNEMAISIGMNPLFFMLPVAVTCSYAFMLPVATPPNAIAFDSGHMKTLDMVKPGLVMNVVCCAVQLLMINTLGVAMFDLNTFPSWINNQTAVDFTSDPFSNSTASNNPSVNQYMLENNTLVL